MQDFHYFSRKPLTGKNYTVILRWDFSYHHQQRYHGMIKLENICTKPSWNRCMKKSKKPASFADFHHHRKIRNNYNKNLIPEGNLIHK